MRKSGEALGRLASVEVAGFISGPPIAALLAGLFGLHAPFLFLAVALALTSPAVARIEEPPVGAAQPKRALRVLVANRGVRSGLALAAGLYLSIGVFDATWARYMTDLGASTTVIAVTLALFALPLVALSPFGGRLADRRGPVRSGVIALDVHGSADRGVRDLRFRAHRVPDRAPALGVRRGIDAVRAGRGGSGRAAVVDGGRPGALRRVRGHRCRTGRVRCRAAVRRGRSRGDVGRGRGWCRDPHRARLLLGSRDPRRPPRRAGELTVGGVGSPAMGICDGRVVIVTGAGRGIGRGHALEFGRQGAKVVVNDLGAEADGTGGSTGPAGEVVEMIRAAGGEAVANGDDVADWEGAQRLVQTAVDAFGGLDVLVNNAGFLRDRMIVSTSEEEWDAVIRVHLKGHFAPTRFAAAYWREQQKAGTTVDGRVINTSSGAGLLGSVGQGTYSAAKAGIAALTLVESAELGRYGVTANAIAPAARTRMTEAVFADTMAAPDDDSFDAMAPENVAPLVVWLGSADSAGITGRVFEVEGGIISVADGWQHGPRVDKGARWDPAEVGPAVRDLLAQAPAPAPVYGAQ